MQKKNLHLETKLIILGTIALALLSPSLGAQGLRSPKPKAGPREGRVVKTIPKIDPVTNKSTELVTQEDLHAQVFKRDPKSKIAKAIALIDRGLNKAQANLGTQIKLALENDLNNRLVVLANGQSDSFSEIESTENRNDFLLTFNHSKSDQHAAHVVLGYYQQIKNRRDIRSFNAAHQGQGEKLQAGTKTAKELQWHINSGTPRSQLLMSKAELDSSFEFLATAFYDRMVGVQMNQKLAKGGVAHSDKDLANEAKMAMKIARSIANDYGEGVMALHSELNGKPSFALVEKLVKLVNFSKGNYAQFMIMLKDPKMKNSFLREFAHVNALRVGEVNTAPVIAQARPVTEKDLLRDVQYIDEWELQRGQLHPSKLHNKKRAPTAHDRFQQRFHQESYDEAPASRREYRRVRPSTQRSDRDYDHRYQDEIPLEYRLIGAPRIGS